MGVMKSTDFIKKAKEIATNYKTLYIYGCFGAPMNTRNKQRYSNNYSYNKQPARTKKIMAASSDTFGFDCVCLIKGILWGWNGNVNATYGGAYYASNGVPDTDAGGMMNYCTNVTTNFKNIVPGELVYMPGHIGIYIGDGLAVECTPIWKDGVQITVVGNIGKKSGYNTRTWTKHGKCKFIDYVNPEPKPAITPTVLRDASKDQLITNMEMNVRLGIETTSESLGVVPKGSIYNYYDMKQGRASKWYAITPDKSQWIAGVNNNGTKYCDIKPKEQPAPTPTPEPPKPTPEPTGLKVGDKVQIIGTGNGSSYGDSNTAYGIGWTREILKIWENRPYPYQVGNNTGTTGFYKENALKKI